MSFSVKAFISPNSLKQGRESQTRIGLNFGITKIHYHKRKEDFSIFYVFSSITVSLTLFAMINRGYPFHVFLGEQMVFFSFLRLLKSTFIGICQIGEIFSTKKNKSFSSITYKESKTFQFLLKRVTLLKEGNIFCFLFHKMPESTRLSVSLVTFNLTVELFFMNRFNLRNVSPRTRRIATNICFTAALNWLHRSPRHV